MFKYPEELQAPRITADEFLAKWLAENTIAREELEALGYRVIRCRVCTRPSTCDGWQLEIGQEWKGKSER